MFEDYLTKVMKYITEVLKSFENDPADTLYQQGYEAAIREIGRYIVDITKDEDDDA